MENLFILILGAFIGAELAYYFIYSPKAQVKRLWKQISYLKRYRADYKSGSDNDHRFNDDLYVKISDQKKKINILLDYYFDPQEDEEFINKNRP